MLTRVRSPQSQVIISFTDLIITKYCPARAESHGYTPFKVDFKQNKVEWALARVDDLVNWGRKVSVPITIPLISGHSHPRVPSGL